MNQPNAKVAEQLWLRAHEYLKRGNLALAVKDLSRSFEILKAIRDPRIRQVHAKWVEVYKAYQEEQKRGVAAPAAEPDFKTLQARAEAAANRGDLATAMSLYAEVLKGQPSNELAAERLAELKVAAERANTLTPGAAPATTPAAAAPAAPVAAQPAPVSVVTSTPATTAPSTPVAAAPSAPAVTAASTPVASTPVASTPVAAAPARGPEAQVAFLEDLLTRIEERRRPVA